MQNAFFAIQLPRILQHKMKQHLCTLGRSQAHTFLTYALKSALTCLLPTELTHKKRNGLTPNKEKIRWK